MSDDLKKEARTGLAPITPIPDNEPYATPALWNTRYREIDAHLGFVYSPYNLPAVENVTGLQSALDGKSATGHKHNISDVNSLQANLDSKLNSSDISGKAIGFAKHLTTENLNDIKTAGVYFQDMDANTSSERNYPELNAGSLVVYRAAGIIQEYRVYNSSRVYVRALYQGTSWTSWAKQYNTLNKPSAADVGALGKTETAANTAKVGSTNLNSTASAFITVPNNNWWGDCGVGHSQMIKKDSVGWDFGGIGGFVFKIGARDVGRGHVWIGFTNYETGGNLVYGANTDGTKAPVWATVYSTRNKPSAADVGTYSQAEINNKLTGKCIGYPIHLDKRNLNDVTATGVYYQTLNANTSTALNYPALLAGSLVVYTAAGIVQEYRVYNSATMYTRAKYPDLSWTPWVRNYNEEYKPTPSAIGAYTQSECNSKFIAGIRLGTLTTKAGWGGAGWHDLAGHILTGVRNNNYDDLLDDVQGRPLQYLLNGTWYTCSSV